jgi:lysosomal acid lipase/cholesteryl ester hydrolase
MFGSGSIVILAISLAFAFASPILDKKNALMQLHTVDPEITMSPTELIEHWGYPSEMYNVTTEDGYILSVYRIPHGRNETGTPSKKKPVVFFQHGLEGSCTNWLENLPQQSAAYIFADAGFDVWLGNFRGNTYSKTHATLSNKDHAYWQFSWDEMAQYDLPAMINRALEVTGADSLYYVGHSMGTMTAFAKLSEDQVFAKKIKQLHALGPIHTLNNIRGRMKYEAKLTKYLQNIASWFGIDQYLPNSRFTNLIAEYICTNPIGDIFCTHYILQISGPDTHQLNTTRMPVYFGHNPAGTSVQNMAHFGQMVNNGKFQMYDYGSVDNMKHYKQKTPPLYDVTKMETPTALYWGAQDYLADPTDVAALVPLIKNKIATVYLQDFNHMDFIWGLRAPSEIYQLILNSMLTDFDA